MSSPEAAVLAAVETTISRLASAIASKSVLAASSDSDSEFDGGYVGASHGGVDADADDVKLDDLEPVTSAL